MKNFILFGILMFLNLAVKAQLGLQVQYQNFTDTAYTFTLPGSVEDIQADRFGFGIDYTFKLKNYRVEFFPTLLYFNQKINRTDLSGTHFNTKITTLGLQLNTHIYFLDIEGDCNCPTWNKDGSFMKKGVFAWISLNGYNTHITQDLPAKRNLVSYGASGGLGLDIGLSKHLTLTPFAGIELEHRPVVEIGSVNADGSARMMYKYIGGLRFAYHWDK